MDHSFFLSHEVERINKKACKLTIKEVEQLPEREIIDLCLPIKRRNVPYSFELRAEYFNSFEQMFDMFKVLLWRFGKIENCEEKLKLSYLRRQKGPLWRIALVALLVFGLSIKTIVVEIIGHLYKVLGAITGYRHDPVYGKALQLCNNLNILSEGSLMRKFGIGYIRAHWIINELSENGYLDKEMNKLTYSRKVNHNKYHPV